MNSFISSSASAKIGLQPLVFDELDSVVAKIKQLADKLTATKRELAAEKSSNTALMNSYTLTLDDCSKLEKEQETRHEHKRKLKETTETLENARMENDNLLKRFSETESALAYANKKFDSLVEQYERDLIGLSEKLKEIQEERCGWNDYKMKLEDQITETKNTLALKEEYIQKQCSIVDNLVLDKQNTSNQLLSNESEHYKNQIVQLSMIIEEWNNKFVTIEESHNREMSEMKIKLNDINKLIERKNEFINQQNTVLSLMEEIHSTPKDDLKINTTDDENENYGICDQLIVFPFSENEQKY